jgi:hypothetical protein
MVLLAKDFPHPDLLSLLVDHAEAQRLTWQAAGYSMPVTPITASQLTILQQRSFHSRITLDHESRPESAVLARLQLNHIVYLILAAIAQRDGEWYIEQIAQKVLDLGASKPFKNMILGGLGRHIVGTVSRSPEIAAIRLTFADGCVLEDRLVDGSALLFAAFDSPEQWAQEATFQIIDRHGRVIASEHHWVNPYERPPAPPPPSALRPQRW